MKICSLYGRIPAFMAVHSPPIRPLRVAVIVACLYGFLGVLYIIISTHMAASASLTADQLKRIEWFKGSLFVVSTSAFLFITVYSLLHRLRRKEQEVDAQRATVMIAGKKAMAGLFAASVAHDLSNLLMMSQNSIDELSVHTEQGAMREMHLRNLQKVHDQIWAYTRRLANTSGKNLLGGIKNSDVASAVRDAVELAKTHKMVKYCAITSTLPEACHAVADTSLLHGALLNLLINAAEAMDGRGRIDVGLQEHDGIIRIEVNDDGPGIPEEDRARVLGDFYTTKPDGSGLGLLAVRYFAEAHGGTFGIEKAELGGACVFMTFKRAVSPANA